MKKIIFILLIILSIVFTGCNDEQSSDNTLKVGATPIPHGEILEIVKDNLAEEGITLEIIEFTDYVKPNLALSEGEIDANFFQHVPYLENFNKNNNTDIVSLGQIHLEPLGIYSNTIKEIKDLKKESSIAIPNDPTNGGRALMLLEKNGLIKLDKNAGLLATEKDVTHNPKNLQFKALEAAQIPRSLDDVDLAIINGNYALEANLTPTEDALIIEEKDSPYANIIAIRKADENKENLKLLLKVLQSKEVEEFIAKKYNGSVIPGF
ncbi:MetQ/NlpA family ABC transporter substrate-binding protein [Clostridium sp. D2Q-11]|uniref:MetQ/NlpA family ABC transporter substrate-binding protein n=1 Tax=Anaeromonas frigoriresistens TaxID=2683708 RepID=A0A942UXJ0_9FIRM|nr:MetQ/NlpA family ABC transporter substrate-binding protein [Anaeromonas frigoriresistens]MBS4537447.1 MetQ/NlpA family ABC transporter substrate-binding protein [Anaeromonas frigoriresistens]